MTESEAQAWIADRVPRETFVQLQAYVDRLLDAAQGQNLIAPSTIQSVWSRHVVDSAQLLALADPSGTWLDVGSGPGLPGLVIAIMGRRPVTLVESRRLRVAFLAATVDALGLGSLVEVAGMPLERLVSRPFDTITARAFASLDHTLAATHRFAHPASRWVLPKGRRASEELAAARATWQGEFSVVPSLTDPTSSIVVARHVRLGECA